MADNVFQEDKEFLIRVKSAVIEKQALERRIQELKAEQKRLERSIAAEEKSIQDEKTSTVKRRRAEVQSSYDKQLSQVRSKRRKAESEKGKIVKSGKVDRIKDETKDIVQDSKEAEKEHKKLLRQNNVPPFTRTKLFYVMFMPGDGLQMLMMVVLFAAFLVGIPFVFTFLIKKLFINPSSMSDGAKTAMTVLIPMIMIIIFIVAYFLIYVKVKMPNIEVLKLGKRYHKAVVENDKQIRSVKRSIKKDQDETRYDVEDIKNRLAEIAEEEEDIREQKHRALVEFDETTARNIETEVDERREGALNELKAQNGGLSLQIEEAERSLQEKSLVLTRDYASHIGDEMIRTDRLDELIAIMESGQASTVSTALAIYRSQRQNQGGIIRRG